MRTFIVLLALSISIPGLFAQQKDMPGPIQDNSFLLEEAYNQEATVIQHINFFMRRIESHDWVYTFTQEWPVTNQKHQFSYTISGAHAGEPIDSGVGFGDTALNYRYQLIGSGETKFAVTPRVSLLLPTGDNVFGRGYGGTGLQTNLAASVVIHPKLVTHWNAGATWVPHAKNEAGARAGVTGFNFGQSFIWLAKPRFNVMLETVYAETQSVAANGKTEWERDLLISPGVRWAYNFENGLQIVPGVAVPFGAGPTSGEMGVILYLSLEHPWKALLGWQRD